MFSPSPDKSRTSRHHSAWPSGHAELKCKEESPNARAGSHDQDSWAVFPDTNQAPVYLKVRDEVEVGAEPASVALVGLTEFAFSSLDSGIKAGKQIWKVANTGAEVHMLGLGKLLGGTTE